MSAVSAGLGSRTEAPEVPSTSGPPAPPPVPARRVAPFARWSTRARMVAVVLAIDLVAALVSCGVIALNARSAVEVETQASLATVEALVADTIRLSQAGTPASLLRTLDLRFQVLRHVRVDVTDLEGQRVRFAAPPRRREGGAPRWFARMITPDVQRHALPIVFEGQRIGAAQIATEPLDEIDEVWGYAVALSVTTFCINLTMLAALYLAFGRVLAPLNRVAEGLTQLERHDYTVRLDPPASRELAAIAGRFNQVAEALSETRAANGRLKRQLLTAQDDERRRTALELHDEFGPCLFALEANAASVTRIAEGEAPPDRARLGQRAADIAMIVGQVQTLNRNLLNRLRPHALGEAPLPTCLDMLVRDFARRHAGTQFSGNFDGLARGYGDLVDLTLFRCVQESMTNAVRHGAAAHVSATAEERDGAIHVEIRDDGRGLQTGLEASDEARLDAGLGDAPTDVPANAPGTGLGLQGMRERLGALDGSFALDNGHPGAVVRIVIPLDPERGEEPTGAGR